MIVIQGKGVSRGVASGPIYFFQRASATITDAPAADIEAEKARIAAAQDFYDTVSVVVFVLGQKKNFKLVRKRVQLLFAFLRFGVQQFAHFGVGFGFQSFFGLVFLSFRFSVLGILLRRFGYFRLSLCNLCPFGRVRNYFGCAHLFRKFLVSCVDVL